MEQARRLAATGQRVALVCYSHGLASYLERITATWPRRQQPAYVGEFHALGVQWGAPEGPDESLRTEETVQFWEHDLPLQMAELATQLEPGHRFDSIVVDEAQDFADAWWDPLLAALQGRRDRRPVRLHRRRSARLQPARLAAGAAGSADPRPQPAQHPPDRQRVPAARRSPDALPRRRGAGRHVRRLLAATTR